MSYKSFKPLSFKYLADVGMTIPSLRECISKWSIGTRMGLANLATVFFGLYAVKLANIPL